MNMITWEDLYKHDEVKPILYKEGLSAVESIHFYPEGTQVSYEIEDYNELVLITITIDGEFFHKFCFDYEYPLDDIKEFFESKEHLDCLYLHTLIEGFDDDE